MGTHYLIFDFKWDRNSQSPIYLETGSALHSQLRPTTMKKVWAHLFTTFPDQKIYIDFFAPEMPEENKPLLRSNYDPDAFPRGALLNQILSGQLTEGVVIFLSTFHTTTAHEFKLTHKLDKLTIINGSSIISTIDKVSFYEYCQRANMAYPPTWLISPATLSRWHTSPQTLAVHPNNTPAPVTSDTGWIIKPPDASHGEGAAFCTDQQLPKILEYLGNRKSQCPLENEPLFSDFWGPAGKHPDQFDIEKELPFLLQKMISTPTQDGIEATYRIVIAVDTDDYGSVKTADVLDIIQKNPMELEKKCSQSIISLTQESARLYGYTKSHISIIEETNPIHQSIANAVKQNIKDLIKAWECYDLSYIWATRVLDGKSKPDNNTQPQRIDVTHEHDYLIYLMGKIERFRFKKYDEFVIASLMKIIEGNVPAHRERVTNIFGSGYFNFFHPLPQSARTDALFVVMACFILTESNPEVLQHIKSMAQGTLAFDNKLRSQTTIPHQYKDDFLLNQETTERIKFIISHVDSRLHHLYPTQLPSVSTYVGTSVGTPMLNFYGPWKDLSYFPLDQSTQEETASNNTTKGIAPKMGLEIGSRFNI